MDEKIENQNKKKSQKRRITILVVLVLLTVILALIFWVLNNRRKDDSKSNNPEVTTDESIAEDENLNDEKETEDVDETSVPVEEGNEKEMVSENYRVSQIKFGGNSAVMDNGKSRNTQLEIYQVKSENILSQEDNEPRILISWKTNKEAISKVEYAKSDGKDAAVTSEEGYGFEHSMLIKNMEFSTIYTYRIESSDKWGNKVNTEYFSAYTGDKSESIFDLITNAIEDVFGWAM
ncbi:MAG TPA: hypothetical protein DDY52_04635 [Candidatus Moranbacteria bacterium]|nr:hypothetical protein [Candidatus Moranbacteria bacterium]